MLKTHIFPMLFLGGKTKDLCARYAITQNFFGAYKELVDCYDPGWVLELPFGDPPVRLEGAREIGRYLAPRLGTFRFTLRLTAVHECLDPDLLVVEYESEGVAIPTGRPYRNVYVALWRFRDGKVSGVKEFPNPMVAAEALQPLPGDDEEE